MVGVLRHDLGTAVHNLVCAVELLLQTQLTERQRKYAEACDRSVRRLLGITEKLRQRFATNDRAVSLDESAPGAPSAGPPAQSPATRRSRRWGPRSAAAARDGRLADELTSLDVTHLAKPVNGGRLLHAIAKAARQGARNPGAPVRVLVADDSADSRLLIGQHLKRRRHEVVMVENGRSAVDTYQSGDYDVVLMDMEMPVMDGYRAIQAIRAWEAAKGKTPTPIIAFTAHDLNLIPLRRHEPPHSVDDARAGTAQEVRVEPDEEIAHLVPGFLAARRSDVRAILRALTGGDYDQIRTIGHMLKGAGGGYGFAAISEIGARLEESATRGDATQIRAAVRALADYLGRVRLIPPASRLVEHA